MCPRSGSPSRRTRPRRSHGWRSSSARRSSGSPSSPTACDPTVSEDETLLSILGKAVFGSGSFLYYVLQFSTFAILILAANTAFADFPRLSSIIARDGFLPRQLANRGDRLVFSNGIVVLAGLAALLIVAFGGDTAALIPLYAVGVFTGFTLSQAGMVSAIQRSHRHVGWQRRSVISLVGSIATVHRAARRRGVEVHERRLDPGSRDPDDRAALQVRSAATTRACERRSTCRRAGEPKRHTHTVVVLVGSVNRGVLQALTYARSLAPDRLIAVSVVSDEARAGTHHEAVGRVRDPGRARTSCTPPYRELDAARPPLPRRARQPRAPTTSSPS